MGESVEALVLDIDRFAMHDGPGIRMSVFLKGCPLRCAWCHSPESQSSEPELLYQQARCVGCLRCVQVCPRRAIEAAPDGASVRIDRAKCVRCFACARHCQGRALRVGGRRMAAKDVLALAARDRSYYEASGGGVTISGGEPLMQPEFTVALLDGLRELGIHTAVETSGMGATAALLNVARRVDLLMYDVKLLDPARHKQYTGASNAQILMNLRALCADEAQRRRVFVRTPLIPGINDGERDVMAIARHVRELGIPGMDVLPYNDMAGAKYEWIGAAYALDGLPARDAGYAERLREGIRRTGLSTEF